MTTFDLCQAVTCASYVNEVEKVITGYNTAHQTD